jgi:hypothetical protein
MNHAGLGLVRQLQQPLRGKANRPAQHMGFGLLRGLQRERGIVDLRRLGWRLAT